MAKQKKIQKTAAERAPFDPDMVHCSDGTFFFVLSVCLKTNSLNQPALCWEEVEKTDVSMGF